MVDEEKPKQKESEFRSPLSFPLYILILFLLAVSSVLLSLFLGTSTVYKFILLTTFNLVFIGVFVSVFWMLFVGLPRVVKAIQAVRDIPGRVKEYVVGE